MSQVFYWYCLISGAIVAGAGLLVAWGVLGWVFNQMLEGTLRRLGYWSIFFAWVREQVQQGRFSRQYRWIFGEDPPRPVDNDVPH